MYIVMRRQSVAFGDEPESAGVWWDAPELSGVETQLVELAPGIAAQLPAVYVVRDHEGMKVRMMLDMTEDGLRAVYVGVFSQDGQPVTGQSLRAVRVAEIYAEAVANVVQVHGEQSADRDESGRLRKLALDPVAWFPMPDQMRDDPAQAPTLKTISNSPDFLQRVAAAFQAASVTGLPPQRFVMDVFNAPRSTAGYWISQARKRGYLAPASKVGD